MALLYGFYLYVLGILYSALGKGLGFNINGDKLWYVDAGYSLIRGNRSFDTLAFSPLFSLSQALGDYFLSLNIKLPFDLPLEQVFRLCFCLLFASLLFGFCELAASCRILSTRNSRILCIIMLSSPYIIRYSTGMYPEYYSFVCGLLVVGRLLARDFFLRTQSAVFNLSPPKNFISRSSELFNFNLYQSACTARESLFVSLLVILCFFRYSLIVFVIPYLLVTFSEAVGSKINSIASRFLEIFFYLINPIMLLLCKKNNRKLVEKYSFICLTEYKKIVPFFLYLSISVLLGFVFSLSFGILPLYSFSFCSSLQGLSLLMGFREAFWSSSCLANFHPDTFHLAFREHGLMSSSFNYMISLFFGFLNVLITVLGLIGVRLMNITKLKQFVFLSLAGLASIVFLIGVGHYRYMLPSLPILYLGSFVAIERLFGMPRRLV